MVTPYLKERLAPGRLLAGTHILLTDTVSSEALGRVGFDFVILDAEGTENSYTSLRNHLTALNAGGTPALARVSAAPEGHVGRVLELGPDGIIFPGINTAAEAERAVSLCLYRPAGRRLLSPLRAAGYGLGNISDFAERDSRMMCRFIQLDSAEALRNIGEIVKVKNIDGFFFSPGLLCGAAGEPKDIFGPRTRELLGDAAALLKDEQIPFGVSLFCSDASALDYWLSLGASLAASGADINYIICGAAKNLSEIKGALLAGETHPPLRD